MYCHIMSEPKTNEDSKEVQTEKLSLKAVPLANGMVKAKTGNTTDATTYADWYKAVYVPAAKSDVATQSAAKPANQVPPRYLQGSRCARKGSRKR